MTRMEQQADVATPSVEATPAEPIVPTGAEMQVATATGTDAAQRTVEEQFGSPVFESMSSEDSQVNENMTDKAEERSTLPPQRLVEAADLGVLTQTLKREDVDINNPKDVESYLSQSFDRNTIKGLELAGVKLPERPTDEDLGRALLPFLQKSQEVDFTRALEKDPASGYASMRQIFLDRLNAGLDDEAAARNR